MVSQSRSPMRQQSHSMRKKLKLLSKTLMRCILWNTVNYSNCFHICAASWDFASPSLVSRRAIGMFSLGSIQNFLIKTHKMNWLKASKMMTNDSTPWSRNVKERSMKARTTSKTQWQSSTMMSKLEPSLARRSRIPWPSTASVSLHTLNFWLHWSSCLSSFRWRQWSSCISITRMIALRTWILQVPWENSFTAFPCPRCIKRRPNATSSFSELARILVLLAILDKLRHLLMMWNSDSSAEKVKSWSVTKSKEFKMITVVSRVKYFQHRKTVTST